MKPTVYLSGGMHSGWQDVVKAAVPDADYFDPREHGLAKAEDYTRWDTDAIKESELMFAFLEESNPSGAGLAYEVGYALASGVHVIFVCEKRDRYFDIVKSASHECYTTLANGIEALQKVVHGYAIYFRQNRDQP